MARFLSAALNSVIICTILVLVTFKEVSSSSAQEKWEANRKLPTCQTVTDCPTHALCITSQCLCKYGYAPTQNASQTTECQLIDCWVDTDCGDNARCFNSDLTTPGYCVCADAYVVHYVTQTCTANTGGELKKSILIVIGCILGLLVVSLLIIALLQAKKLRNRMIHPQSHSGAFQVGDDGRIAVTNMGARPSLPYFRQIDNRNKIHYPSLGARLDDLPVEETEQEREIRVQQEQLAAQRAEQARQARIEQQKVKARLQAQQDKVARVTSGRKDSGFVFSASAGSATPRPAVPPSPLAGPPAAIPPPPPAPARQNSNNPKLSIIEESDD